MYAIINKLVPFPRIIFFFKELSSIASNSQERRRYTSTTKQIFYFSIFCLSVCSINL